MTIRPPNRKHLWIWWLWLAGFYSVWLWLVYSNDGWATVCDHWPIALAMAAGSYAAGSTPMGGGTVAFPVLVLLFDQPPQLGRDFSFAVQSVGMVSASVFILARRQPLAWSMLAGALLGSLAATPLGILFVAPSVPALWIKLVFAVLWGSFGLLHLWRTREIASHHGMTEFDENWDFRLGLAVGVFSGLTVVPVAGVGIDMVLYPVLVLLFRADLKIAIPTSVIVMAFTSVVGVGTKVLTTGLSPGVFDNWLAAAPVVALGAPAGVLVVSLVGRRFALATVAILCVGQLAWTLHDERTVLGLRGTTAALAAVGLFLVGFEKLRRWGATLAGENGPGTGTAPEPGREADNRTVTGRPTP